MNIRLVKICVCSIAPLAVLQSARISRTTCTSASGAIMSKEETSSVPKPVAICIMVTQADDHGRGGMIVNSIDGAATLRRSILHAYNLKEAKTVPRMVGLEPFNRNNAKSVEWMQPQVENVSVYQVPMMDSTVAEIRLIAMVNDDVDESPESTWLRSVGGTDTDRRD